MSDKTVLFNVAGVQRGYVMAPRDLLHRTNLSHGAKIVWLLLASYAWQDESCWPGQDRLAAEAPMGPKALRTAIAELAAFNLLIVQRRGQGQTNRYLLNGRYDRSRPVDMTDNVEVVELETVKPLPLSTVGVIGAQTQRAGAARAVWDAWIESTGSTRSVWDIKRQAIVRRQLRNYPVDELCDAVRGWKFSPWHSGDNPSRTKYNSFELCLKDAQHIETFRDLYRGGGPSDPTSVREFLDR